MSRKTTNISILQFDERLITRLRVRRSAHGIEIIGFDQERGQWSSRDGSLQPALKAFAAKHKLAEDHVYTVLPRHDMTARILDLPSQDLPEIEGMVRLSAEEYVPFSAEELVTDQCILTALPDGHAKVLAVFAHRDVVDAHVKTLQGAGIDPEQIYLSTACLASAAMVAKNGPSGRYALVNLASGGLEALVLRGTRVEYGRAVASQQDWQLRGDGDQEVIEELNVEVRASLSAYRRESEDGEDVESVCLCSEGVDVREHCEALFHETGIECGPATFAQGLVTHGAELLPTLPLVALGAALLAQGRGPVSITLLPKSLIKVRTRAGIKREAVRFGGLAAAIAIALIAWYALAVHQRNAYIRDLTARIAKIEPRAKGIISKQRQLQILQQAVDRSGSAVGLLAELINLYPDADINVTRFQFVHNDKIEVTGRCKSLKTYQKLVQTLIDVGKASIPQFARAQSLYENKTAEKGLEIWEYKLALPFPEALRPTDEEGGGSLE